ncbi:MAG: type II toxin-antitoxin system VapC family toxin [Candidatus Scalindua sp.]
MILIDTDICIELLRGNKTVIEKRQNCDEQVSISFMTVGELFYGAERSTNRLNNLNVVDEFLLSIDVINSDLMILKKFGELKSFLYKKRILLPDADILIASTVLTKCTKLITGNKKHFNRFDNLAIENWLV